MEVTFKHLRLTFDTPDGEGTLEGALQGTFTLTLPGPEPEPEPPPIYGDYIEVPVGASIQAAVDANPEGTKFLIKQGVHSQQQIIPKAGNVFQGETGAILDGEYFAEFAFRTGDPPYPAHVEIRGLEIRNYASPDQRAAVEAGLYSTSDASEGWVIEDNEVHHNGCIGVRLGNRCRVLNNYTHHNHCMNISGSGDEALVEGNRLEYGNYEYRYVPGFEAGGTKFTVADGMIIRGNTFLRNSGPSLWFDESATNMLIENNTIDDGDQEGIVIEICYRAVIRNNVITRCGWRDSGNRYTWLWNSAIGVHSSPDCEVYGNTVSDCWSGIVGVQQDRGTGPHGDHIISNLNVHDNNVSQTAEPIGDQIAAAAGIGDDTGGTAAFDSRNNRFTANTYTLGPARQPFAWMNGPRTEAEWQAYGQQ